MVPHFHGALHMQIIPQRHVMENNRLHELQMFPFNFPIDVISRVSMMFSIDVMAGILTNADIVPDLRG